ncbi:AraC family transcriptional regulator [Paenibacillus helianthi]|uniref:AraC family transcriptional regulator n=1 Tax=Paenibacillus helianthi TaxID=1349432 RepID=A0ABX3EWQ4_9BACL|nr:MULTISPECIES: helix-turn-helix domain-containing protein [Paenibacillus]OKP70373.1 AraC family transcriptional regulator [Paenibacillus sp. P3E]OKP89864.1 AraC family transcriptional regulator [Paenibacillus sp. P32E]OKP91048.1 AraC family transcriptional regulator [Paenibacillus helianthi]
MNRSYFKSKLFLRYIFSYLLILVVPLIIVTAFIYRNATRSLQSEIELSHINQLNQAKTIIDGRIKELNDMASRISYDERLTPYRVHDPYFSREAISALNNYKATSSIIGELFLYYYNDDRIYSSRGMSNLEVFASNYSFHNWTKNTLFHDLNKVKFPAMRPADLVNRTPSLQQSILAYIVPITPNNPNPHGTIMYFIPESELNRMIDSVLGSYHGLTYIFDNNGQILTSNGNERSLSTQEVKSLFILEPGIHNEVLNGKSHSIISVKSSENGWSYVTLMPSAQIFSNVLQVRSFIIMLLLISVAVGGAIALMLARMQYVPISELVKFANSTSRSKRPFGNELEGIRILLQEHSVRADLQEPYARNHVLMMLLKYGNTQGVSSDLLGSFDFTFESSHYFVVIIECDEFSNKQDESQNRQAIFHLFTQVSFPELSARAYSVELPQPNQLALIIGYDSDGKLQNFDHIRHIVEATRNNLLEMFDIHPVIGVGTCYSSISLLNQSYIEACSALETNISSHESITFFEKLFSTSEQDFWVPNHVLLKLSQSLKQGSFEVAERTISVAISELPTSLLSSQLLRFIVYDILNTMLKTASELGIHNLMHEVPPKITYNSLEELKQAFVNLASRICSQVEHDQKNEEHTLMDQIVLYIDSHYREHTLSLETISQEYSISPSHLSRSFKEKVGINFIQYIWQKRMNEVMHKLITTNDSLKDIIVQVGYLDTPNFIRKFKKETGYTPGQYRSLHIPEEKTGTLSDL